MIADTENRPASRDPRNGSEPVAVKTSETAIVEEHTSYDAPYNGLDAPYEGARMTDYLGVLWRRKWFLLAFIIGGTALIAAATFFMPYTYTASATLMPPDQGGQSIGFGDLVKKGAGGFNLAAITSNPSSEILGTILQSRTLADSLVTRFDYLERMNLAPEQRQLAIEEVQRSLLVDVTDEGFIGVMYSVDTEPSPTAEEEREASVLAADVVNEAIALLDLLNRMKNTTEARRSREFLEQMVDRKRQELNTAQTRLMEFQARNRAYALDTQVEGAVTALAEVQAQIQIAEVELARLQREMNPDAQIIENVQAELAELRRQRSKLTGSDVLGMQLGNVPALVKEYASLKLDVEVATQVYTLLEGQYNSEQVQEARDLPTVTVLDEAKPPLYRSAPQRKTVVLIAFFVLLLLGLVIAFAWEFFASDAWRYFRGRIFRRSTVISRADERG